MDKIVAYNGHNRKTWFEASSCDGSRKSNFAFLWANWETQTWLRAIYKKMTEIFSFCVDTKYNRSWFLEVAYQESNPSAYERAFKRQFPRKLFQLSRNLRKSNCSSRKCLLRWSWGLLNHWLEWFIKLLWYWQKSETVCILIRYLTFSNAVPLL